MSEAEIKQRVRQFYDQVGWLPGGDGHYQNARYEDLRPVSAEYIRRCHLRVKKFLRPTGRYLLDAGSGPVQYPEYLVYSENYTYRVCADISIVALQEARQRLGERGCYVVADVANLPFCAEPFEGVVSLHTLHHLPLEDQARAYDELFRVLRPGSTAVVVNGWTDSPLMRRVAPLVRLAERLGSRAKRAKKAAQPEMELAGPSTSRPVPTGTFIRKQDAAWLKSSSAGGCGTKSIPGAASACAFCAR